ncbi:MAG: nucleotidyltransferase family protein [Thaumarchaeota archaeon]|nr:nucleotidyltransferase family protein [Nitrososphaerota archaeon]
MVTKAAVLCGGEGTRLRPLSNYFQKTMIPIGTARKPLLSYIVRLLGYNDVRDITLLTGYRSEEIEQFFGDGSKLGVSISYSKDREGTKGSAGSLANALGEGKLQGFDNLVVYYGDVLSSMDIRALVAQHEARRSALTLALSRDYKVPVGVAQVEHDRVTSFKEKPVLPLNVTVGCLVISSGCVPVLREATAGQAVPDIMTHFVPRVIENGMLVSPFYIDGFWYDVGTTEAYEKLDSELVERNLKFLDY